MPTKRPWSWTIIDPKNPFFRLPHGCHVMRLSAPPLLTLPRLAGSALAAFMLIGIAAPSHAQRIRWGRLGGGPGWSLQTPSFSIGVSPLGGTRITTPYGTRRYRHDPFPPPVDLSRPPGFAPRDFGREEARNGYAPPQDRYRALTERYGYPSPYSPRSPYSSGAPDSSGAPAARRDATRPAAPQRNLPFARSPYDARPPAGFGITGNAPARSLSERELKRELIRSARTLAATLEDTADGDVWQEFLEPATIAAVLQDEASRATLAATLSARWDHFRGTAGNPELTWVTRLDGFPSTYRLLEEWMRRHQPESLGAADAFPGSPAGSDPAPAASVPESTPAVPGERKVEEIPAPLPQPRRSQTAPPAAEEAPDASTAPPRQRYAL